MATYYEYTTVNDVRAVYISGQETTDDGLILSLIKSTSREINQECNRHFAPRVQDLEFDTLAGVSLDFAPFDVQEVTTLTNGDGTAFTASAYKLYPLNSTPKQMLIILGSSGSAFTRSTAGDPDGAISGTFVTGYHDDYANAWLDTGYTLSGSVSAVTTSASASGTLCSGQFLKIDSEWLYCNASGSAGVGFVRGVNGSTSGSHADQSMIYAWDFGAIGQLCRMATAAYYRLRANPVGETVSLDGVTFQTPKDVRAYLDHAIALLGFERIGLG
jgi:hypothetical protein